MQLEIRISLADGDDLLDIADSIRQAFDRAVLRDEISGTITDPTGSMIGEFEISESEFAA